MYVDDFNIKASLWQIWIWSETLIKLSTSLMTIIIGWTRRHLVHHNPKTGGQAGGGGNGIQQRPGNFVQGTEKHLRDDGMSHHFPILPSRGHF